MRLGRQSLYRLLHLNAVELQFTRRHPVAANNKRRMLCTNDMTLLRSTPGQTILNFRMPTGSLGYDPVQHNLVITWDLFLQNWRAVPCESVEVIAVISTNPPSKFWQFFMENLKPMSGQHKRQFINS